MSAKTPIFLLLGMCLSFSVVLAVVLAMRPHSSPPKRRVLASTQTRPLVAPEPQTRPATVHARPEPKAAPPAVELKPVDLTLSAEAARELDQVKKDLRQQIALLKKDRDQMLNNLAKELVSLPPAEAAAQLETLDDESAALVLVRLKPEKRQSLLKHLEPGRANRLNLALTPPSR
ncbi:MAG: hypothetical protein HYW07_03800 [Candidatus Latescibacteria bacterium]|nr:hypothetical protein [Candidatus Latescibacterota bacterium]